MNITLHTTNLKQFRTSLYQNINNRADSLMDLLDAMCSVANARSVVEYCLAACYRRSYSTIFKAIDEMRLAPMWLPYQLGPYLPVPKKWPFWLLIADVTPGPRPYAQTLEDRGMVYQPEVVKGKLPVTIGHQYSTVALGLEPEVGVSHSWVLPLLTERVATSEDKEMTGAKQIEMLLQDTKLPFGLELTVEVGDSGYSKRAYLHAHRKFPNLVTVVRVRGNRTFYQQYVPTEEEMENPSKGRPRSYGERFSLSDPKTWTEADDTLTLWETSRRGKVYRVEVQACHNLLMTGKHKPKRLPMHRYPFTLVRIMRYDEEGNPAFKRPLWLLVMGARRHELTLEHIYQAYSCRFDIEHFFRFGKQKLLLVDFQTPDVQREENWWQLVHIAYAQLWMARHVADALPRPWERNLPAMKQPLISPTLVQRDFPRIIRQLGTPAKPPKPRGISPGRRKGMKLPKRPRQKVVVKSR
ncbi:MAG: transposase, partial [Gammaproteobacteria bacterium]|nr:transposase [Gammaproteobacteria bacterium]